MREKIVSRRRPTPKIVNLPNGTLFVSRYERIRRKQLPRNIRVPFLFFGNKYRKFNIYKLLLFVLTKSIYADRYVFNIFPKWS